MIYFKDENNIVHTLGSYTNFPTGEPLVVDSLPEPSEKTFSENYKFYKINATKEVFITIKNGENFKLKKII